MKRSRQALQFADLSAAYPDPSALGLESRHHFDALQAAVQSDIDSGELSVEDLNGLIDDAKKRQGKA